VKIGIGMCRDPSLVLIYGQFGMENCMMVLIETVHEAFKERKLFCPTPTTKYSKSTIRMEVFWSFKDLSLNDELAITVFDHGDVTMHGVNNLTKKRVSCRDNSLPNGLWLDNIIDFENMGNTV